MEKLKSHILKCSNFFLNGNWKIEHFSKNKQVTKKSKTLENRTSYEHEDVHICEGLIFQTVAEFFLKIRHFKIFEKQNLQNA